MYFNSGKNSKRNSTHHHPLPPPPYTNSTANNSRVSYHQTTDDYQLQQLFFHNNSYTTAASTNQNSQHPYSLGHQSISLSANQNHTSTQSLFHNYIYSTHNTSQALNNYNNNFRSSSNIAGPLSSDTSRQPRKKRFKQLFFGASSARGSSFGSFDNGNCKGMNRHQFGHLNNRRPLKCPILQAPDYLVDEHTFIDSYIEVESQLLGILKDVQRNFTVNSRQTVLHTIDRAKQLGHLPYTYQPCEDIILSMSIHNVKFMRRENDSLLFRIFLHEIDSVSMVVDDAATYFLIKVIPSSVASRRSADCKLIILKFVNSSQAEELCALFKQLFSVLFNESALSALATASTLSHDHMAGATDFRGTATPPSRPFSVIQPSNHQHRQISSPGYITGSFNQIPFRTSSMAFDSSPRAALYHQGSKLRPLSALNDPFLQIPKSNSMCYDATQLSPSNSTGSENFVISSLPKNSSSHQRAFSDIHETSTSATYVKLTSTPRHSAIPSPSHSRSHSIHTNTEFLRELDKILTEEELKRFIMIINNYKNGGNSADFIENLGALLGNERLHIIRHLSKILPINHETEHLNFLLNQKCSRVGQSQSSMDASNSVGSHSRRGTAPGVGGNDSSSVSSQSLAVSEEPPNNHVKQNSEFFNNSNHCLQGGQLLSYGGGVDDVKRKRNRNSPNISKDSATGTATTYNSSSNCSMQELSSSANSSSNTSSFNQSDSINIKSPNSSTCGETSINVIRTNSNEKVGKNNVDHRVVESKENRRKNTGNSTNAVRHPNNNNDGSKNLPSFLKNAKVAFGKKKAEVLTNVQEGSHHIKKESNLSNNNDVQSSYSATEGEEGIAGSSLEIPKELLELDSMLAEMAVCSNPNSLEKTTKFTSTTGAGDENKTLEAPAETIQEIDQTDSSRMNRNVNKLNGHEKQHERNGKRNKQQAVSAEKTNKADQQSLLGYDQNGAKCPPHLSDIFRPPQPPTSSGR